MAFVITAGRPSRATWKLRDVVRQFAPNWFTVTMGTGILSLALNQAPFAMPELRRLAEALWAINIGFFVTFAALYAARWVLFPHEARRIFGHSVASMFVGAIPMGLATIINGFLAFGFPRWGQNAITTAQVLWWLDTGMAVICGLGVPYLMFTRQEHSMEKMTAVWLLPIVAAEVSAACAGLLVPHLSNAYVALQMLVLGYALWAFSVPLAMGILVILLLRLVLHKLPHKDMAPSSWLALGPVGTGALGLLLLGAAAPKTFTAAGIPVVGDVAHGIGVIGGAVLWGYGAWWLVMAAMTTVRYLRDGIPFNLGWWAFTFPLGVYSIATLTLAQQTHLESLTDIGGALVICLALLWVAVAARTLHGVWHRYLLVSTCLEPGSTRSTSRS
jgi:C4-dicarboxylate transporter/malic acid transport protein